MSTRQRMLYFLVYVLVVVIVFTGMALSAPKRPTMVAELALYEGADRQQILEEGARKEGKLVLYTTGILTQTVRPKVAAFQKRYPYIKVEIWRASTSELLPRTLEEYKSGRHVVDVIEVTQGGELSMEEGGILQPFYSPNLAYIEEGAVRRAPSGGVFAAGHYENGHVLGYNTKLITREELPKTYQDLLDPKWKGKVPISGEVSGHSWIGVMLVTYGEDFVRRIAKQNFVVHIATAAAIRDMIINGEYAFSPTLTDAHVKESKKKGAPVDWIPLEPVHVNLGQIALYKHPPHPHAVLLFIDFDLSKETGELYKATGYVSPRKDVFGEATYKKYYGPSSTEQFVQWVKLFDELFLKK